jgi:hypothetical protein
MLLTQEQQSFITKTLNRMAALIREEQQNDSQQSVERQETASNERLVRWGRQAAYEKAYHIVKTAAEESFVLETQSLDQELNQLSIKLDAQSKAFESIIINMPDSDIKKSLDEQVSLLRIFVKKLELIIRQTKIENGE